MKKHVYEYDKLVIGGSLASLLYGYLNGVPVLYTTQREPLFYEVDKKGNNKSQLWKELSFQLSLAGLLPFSGPLESIRIESPGILKAFPGGPTFSTFHYSDLVVFDDEKIEGWDGTLKKKSKYKVLDWIIDKQSSPHDFVHISSPGHFVKEVYFYPSERADGNPKKKKDILSISYLKKEHLDKMDYSDVYARFKVLDVMKSSGILGRRNGFDPKTGKVRRLSIKIESVGREVYTIPIEPFSETALLKQYYSKQPKNYLHLLKKYLHGKD